MAFFPCNCPSCFMWEYLYYPRQLPPRNSFSLPASPAAFPICKQQEFQNIYMSTQGKPWGPQGRAPCGWKQIGCDRHPVFPDSLGNSCAVRYSSCSVPFMDCLQALPALKKTEGEKYFFFLALPMVFLPACSALMEWEGLQLSACRFLMPTVFRQTSGWHLIEHHY